MGAMLAHRARHLISVRFSFTSVTSFTTLTSSLLRPRLRRHHPISSLIHHQLPVVFPAVLDQSVSQVVKPVQMRPAVIYPFTQPFFALCLSHAPAYLHALLPQRHHLPLLLHIV